MQNLDDYSPRQLRKAIEKCGSIREFSRQTGIPRSTVQDRLYRESSMEFQTTKLKKPIIVSKPRKGIVKRFIFSSAQNNTPIHHGFLDNLEAYAAYLNAEIVIGTYTYNKTLFSGTSEDMTYHWRIKKYITNERYDIGDKVVFCGEMNISPTAVNPLSGFETYTRSKWGIFPHPRVSLESVATMFNEPSKIIMTTGTITKPNYIHQKAGIKAEFHHVIGAVVVEIDGDGDVFARHIQADRDGSFRDLDHYVFDTYVSSGHPVEAITWGDVHLEQIDDDVARGSWGVDSDLEWCIDSEYSMLDTLKPRYQFFHDSLDFQARNHHNLNDPYHRFDMYWNGKDNVHDAIERVAKFLEITQRDNCRSIVVESNHDRMLLRWLAEADYKNDPANAIFYLQSQLRRYLAIAEGQKDYNLLEDVIRSDMGVELGCVEFLQETSTFPICNGIECALHGHKGSGGARPSMKTFARMGPKANIAHTHAAGILEGIYRAGTASKLDMGYNKGGLSNWNHSHIVTYPNGKRAIVTMQGRKWRAESI